MAHVSFVGLNLRVTLALTRHLRDFCIGHSPGPGLATGLREITAELRGDASAAS